jgi:hypothetical protein
MENCCLENSLGYLTIPQGLTGGSGAPGGSGATGLSAYEIAVLNGFVGTESQWLASLDGANGTNGTSVLYWLGTSDFSSKITDVGTWEDFFASYTLAANELLTNGDEIRIEMVLRTILDLTSPTATARIRLGSSTIRELTVGNGTLLFITIKARKVDTDKLLITSKTDFRLALAPGESSLTSIAGEVSVVGSLDFTITNLIQLQINQSKANFVEFGQFAIYKYKIQ